MRLDDGSYRMYYSGGTEITHWKDFYIGMASSLDGINWKKYNDPSTKEHPFAESDPVFMNGEPGDWDDSYVWMANVARFSEGYRMYFMGASKKNNILSGAIGYAISSDGMRWEKYASNPVYTIKDDPCLKSSNDAVIIENPSILYMDSLCFMYYGYGTLDSGIGLATAKLPLSGK
jgi:sucrose-6-phosphate hydrolase SacC (GH32 family)